jgi:folate-binding Fe-S cluster repair protein YgfZ
VSTTAELGVREPLVEDEAHHLKSRAVLRLEGGQLPVLQDLVTASLDGLERGCVFALHLDDEGTILADIFVVQSEGEVLLDCGGEDASALRERLVGAGLSVQDVTGEWRVFAELPNQSTAPDGPAFVRVSDPRRRELGARVYRPAEGHESTAWRHEGLYLVHANKLGVPPGAALLRRFGVDPVEAHFDALGALDADHVPSELAARLRAGRRPQRRLLPFRAEPTGTSLPDMDGAPLLANQTPIGVAVTRQGLFGLGLVDLAPWRKALAEGVQVRCATEPVLITWPTWIARESEGRASPAAWRDRTTSG